MSDRVRIFDTTLRDGEQSPGATMNLQEKLRLAHQLEVLGVDCLEAGFPASSQGDFESVQAIAGLVKDAEVAGLARCTPGDIDRAWEAIRHAAQPRIHTFLATSPIHMEYKLRKSPDQVVEMAVAGVKRAAGYTPNVEFSAEDASRSHPDFLVRVVTEVIKAGATTINLPDTVGYAIPSEYSRLIRYVIEHTPNAGKAIFSVHCHDDLGLSVANSLAAVEAGARQVEVTLCGIGERAGNTSLEEVVMALKVRRDVFGVDTGIRTEQLFPSCRMLSMIIGQPIPANKAIVGGNAFAHESGIHQHGVISNAQTYEIMKSTDVGIPQNTMVLGKHSGKHALREKLASMGYELDDQEMENVFARFKDLADKKKNITGSDIEALVLHRRNAFIGTCKLLGHVVNTGHGVPNTSYIKLQRGDEVLEDVAIGTGPLDASFQAINRMLGMEDIRLESFSLNAVTDGEDAVGEAVVKLEDKNGATYTGTGLSTDIIESSIRAYVNGINKMMEAAN